MNDCQWRTSDLDVAIKMILWHPQRLAKEKQKEVAVLFWIDRH